MDGKRYAFNMEWYDSVADLHRPYILLYWVFEVGTNQIEIIDAKMNRKFLKKTPYPDLSLRDLFIGNTLPILGRQMTVKSYGDEVTRRELESYESRTITFISQSAYNEIGKIISDVEQSDSQDAATVCATRMELASFFKDSFVVIELLGNDCLNRWSSYCNEKYPIQSVYTSADQHEAETLIDLLFKKRLGKTSATYDSCTLCLIKPHILKEGKAGEIITSILETGFMISAIELYRVNRATADEFLEVYKGVIPEFALCVDSLTNGALIALEIRAENPVNTFRTYCGPYDVEIAKQLRPKTLRAVFGHDKVNNAVHCTDLEEDGTLECEFFFQILNSTC